MYFANASPPLGTPRLPAFVRPGYAQDAGILSGWLCGEGAGNTVYDLTGTDPGVLQGTGITWCASTYGPALLWTRQNAADYVRFASGRYCIPYASAWSVETLIYVPAAATGIFYYAGSKDSNAEGTFLTIGYPGAGQVRCTMRLDPSSGGLDVNSTGAAITPGQWHHLVWTYDGSGSAAGISCYVNGLPVALTVASNTTPSTPGGTNWVLGRSGGSNTSSPAYAGTMIAKHAIYSRALRANEVTALSRAPYQGLYPQDASVTPAARVQRSRPMWRIPRPFARQGPTAKPRFPALLTDRDPALALCLPLNEQAGTKAYGATNRYNGTLSSGLAAAWNGQGLTFGANGWVDFGDVLNIPAGQNFSFSVRFTPGSTGATRYLLAKGGDAVGDPGYELRLSSGTTPTLRLSQVGGGTIFQIAATVTVDGTKAHTVTAIVNRAATAQLYVDGVLAGSADVSAYNGDLTNAKPLTLGAYSSHTLTSAYTGSVDTLRFWLRALSPDEARYLHLAPYAGLYPQQAPASWAKYIPRSYFETLSLGRTLSVTPAATAQVAGALALATQRALESSATGNALVTLDLGEARGLAAATSASLAVSVELDRSSALEIEANAGVEASLSLALTVGLEQSGSANARQHLALARQEALFAVSRALAAEGITLESVREVSAHIIVLAVHTPLSRLLRVLGQDRVYDVPAY